MTKILKFLVLSLFFNGIALSETVKVTPWITSLQLTPTNWEFVDVGELAAIKRNGKNNKTEIQLLNCFTKFSTTSLQTETPLPATDESWQFTPYDGGGVVGDFYWGDGIAAINTNSKDIKCTADNGCTTELHVLNKNTQYTTYKFQTKTALHPTNSSWSFATENGYLLAITRTGAMGTEVHKLNKKSGYRDFVYHTATTLGQTDSDWEFGVLGRSGDIAAIKKHSDENSGLLEIKIITQASFYKNIARTIKTDISISDHYWKFTFGQNRIMAIHTNNTPSGNTEVYVIDVHPHPNYCA